MIEICKGLIFNDSCKSLVNTVNCDGFMGKGIALEFKLRFPKMFNQYKEDCKNNLIKIGKIRSYEENGFTIYNFPTKDSYKMPSEIDYVVRGLKDLSKIITDRDLKCISMPFLGTHNGGLNQSEVLDIMRSQLSSVNSLIKIYDFDSNIMDNTIISLKQKLESEEDLVLGLTEEQSDQILKLINHNNLRRLSDLKKIKGIGDSGISKIYAALRENDIKDINESQLKLF